MLSAGLGALVAALMSWISVVLVGGARPAWAASLQTFGLEIALAFLLAAAGASVLMPSAADLTRPIRQDEDTPTAPALLLLLGALALVALLQVPSIAAWWTEDRALLRQAIGSSPDPMGFNLIPQVILLSLPTLAAAVLLTCVLASILGMLARVDLVFHTLAACAALQAGLVIGLHLVLHAFRAVGGAIQGLFATTPDAAASAQTLEWFARHDAVSAPVGWRLLWLLGGYLVAVAATEIVAPRRSRVQGPSEAATETPERIAAQPVVPVPRFSSPAASVFDQSTYAIKPRQTLLELFLRHYSVYDIQSVPPSARARFSFSWKTQVVRREPGGPELYALKPAERHGVLRARSYVVIDLAAGSPVGTLKPAGSEWEILDAAGAPAVRVVEENAGAGFARYVASAGEQVVCRFTWAMHGLSVASATLDVEFLPGCDAYLDRSLAIALAPLLEHKGRRKSEWANR
jgi:hypothetical protein